MTTLEEQAISRSGRGDGCGVLMLRTMTLHERTMIYPFLFKRIVESFIAETKDRYRLLGMEVEVDVVEVEETTTIPCDSSERRVIAVHLLGVVEVMR